MHAIANPLKAIWVMLIWPLAAQQLNGAGIGFDTGTTPASFLHKLEQGSPTLFGKGVWLRVRGIDDLAKSGVEQLAEQRHALRELQNRGFKICALASPQAVSWHSGTRSIVNAGLPLDLREAYDWAAALERSANGLVDVWEIGNEPDIGFLGENPETYAAFLKACYWGGNGHVLMAGLAMPPGPYLEALLRNGVLSYTAGLNFHYYGYDQDFSGVCMQFQEAISEPNALPEVRIESTKGRITQVPVFVSEFGYGMFGKDDSTVTSARVRQWRWFKSVSQQIAAQRIEAPMAFLLSPYLESDLNEFGLTMPGTGASERNGSASIGRKLQFAPSDFAAVEAEPWMDSIGRRFGSDAISPALAYLAELARTHVYSSTTWQVNVDAPSSVVIDFVAGPLASAVKTGQGYSLSADAQNSLGPIGELQIYNLSTAPVTGTLIISDGSVVNISQAADSRLLLKPMEITTIPVHLKIPWTKGRKLPWNAALVPDQIAVAASRFSTTLYAVRPEPQFGATQRFNLQQASSTDRLAELHNRLAVAEEPRVGPVGRWLATKGLSVIEDREDWKFEIKQLPSDSLRPAIAELPLSGFTKWPGNALLRFTYKCSSAGLIPTRYAHLSSTVGGLFQVQIRCANGNLYEVWPRRSPGATQTLYSESTDSFTMSLYGRANLPWRAGENVPIGLVFTFWPRTLPTEIDVFQADILQASE